MWTKSRWLVVVFVLALVAAACTSSSTEDTTTTAAAITTTSTTLGSTTTEAPPATEAPPTTEAPAEEPEEEDLGRTIDAPKAAITVDGDSSDWASVSGLATTLEPIEAEAGEPIDNRDITVKMAHDDENVFALVTVEDDYNWDADDTKLSAAFAMLFPVDTGGPHMGADDEEAEISTGLVDIWHWELECAAGTDTGGAVGPAGDGKDPGNDANCNFDDEWATDAETREDDNTATGENSLLGVWSHSTPTEDAQGVWSFEMSRPLQTGDEQDAQFAVGESTSLAIAYWDPDFGPDGWEDDTHVQSANQEWINVNLISTPAEEAMSRSVDAPVAAITVDGNPSDWALVPGLATTLEPIVAEAGEPIDNRDITIKVAHDDQNLYAMFTVVDDYNWNADDGKLSSALAFMFPVDTGGPHMGADDVEGEVSAGMVDIWHWELECAAGVESGGSVNPPGDGKDPGNDSVCNYDDEWATDAETREDDNGAGAENSLLGVWSHSNPTDDAAGIWYFETSRPLQTDDEQDAQLTVGDSTMLALAYWDSDFGPDGWEDDTHVQSSNQGWIEINLG
ncbi:MAG: hypothetical protein GWP18_04035 [Proteobacteria bacterium]|nr:hypothetical protein [Pseudomonadota bacterium]